MPTRTANDTPIRMPIRTANDTPIRMPIRTSNDTPIGVISSTSRHTSGYASCRSAHSVGDLSGSRTNSCPRGCTSSSRHARTRTPHGPHGSLDVSLILLVLVQTRLDLLSEIRVPVREVLDPLIDTISRLGNQLRRFGPGHRGGRIPESRPHLLCDDVLGNAGRRLRQALEVACNDVHTIHAVLHASRPARRHLRRAMANFRPLPYSEPGSPIRSRTCP